jgi:hypothetical protein
MLEVVQRISKEVVKMMLKEDRTNGIEVTEQLLGFFYSCRPNKSNYAISHIFISSRNRLLPPLVDAKARQTSFDTVFHVHLRFDRTRTPAFCC